MKLEREDYMDPQCVLCGKPGEEAAHVFPVMFRINEDRLGMSGAGDQVKLLRTPGPGCHIL